MNPLKWLSKLFSSRRSSESSHHKNGRKNYFNRKYNRRKEYRHENGSRICSDCPGTPEWKRFWLNWELNKYSIVKDKWSLPRTEITLLNTRPSEVNPTVKIDLSPRWMKKFDIVPPTTTPQNHLTRRLSTCQTNERFTTDTRILDSKITEFSAVMSCEKEEDEDNHQILDTMNIRANGYKIKSYGFPIAASASRGSLIIKVEVGQPNGLVTTRINSSSCTISMEVVGVQDHIIKKWLAIKARTSAQVINLSSPVVDTEGFVLFAIPLL